MGGEFLFEGLDGAEISDKTLEFLIDVQRQSGSPTFDSISNYLAEKISIINWIIFGIAILLHLLLKNRKMLTIKFIAINHW